MTDKHSYVVITLLVLLLALAPAAVAQAAPSGQTPTPTPEGIDHGGYNIQQSIEIGYRHTDVSGVGADNSMFNTFINLQTGPRLLEQTFSMRSLNRSAGLLFDDLFVNSFGWGGDPNNAARMRMSKYKWYNFSASFRRDQNYFDYNLLVNPLQATPHVNFSPHMFQVRRRMADLNLTLAPQSKFSVRLGYSRNRADGPTLSTIHGAVDGLLSSPWSTTYSNYQVGFDMKFIPKTNISFDQFLEYGKNDTDASLDPFQSLPFQAAVGGFTSLEFGLPPATASSTCVLTNPLGCTGFTSYSRMQRVRTSTPTSQLSFQSHPHQKVELTGRLSYSSTDLSSTYQELFTGYSSRTRETAFNLTGPVAGQRIAVASDLGVTIHITDKLSLSDSFRFLNQRMPVMWTSNNLDTTINARTPANYKLNDCITNAALCTTATIITPYSNFLGQDSKTNTLQFEYQFTPHVGARLGYRYGTRDVNDAAFLPTASAGADTWNLVEHTALFGAWLRPNSNFRTNFEVELTSNGGDGLGPNAGFITRLSPTHQQHYRVRTSYTPVKGFTLGGTVNILENRNGRKDINYLGHNRNLGLSASYHATDKVTLDLSYNYGSYLQNAWMCFVDTGITLPPGTTTWTAATPTLGCPTQSAGASAPNYVYSIFADNTHYGSFLVMFHPVKRVTANLGYGVTKVGGNIQDFTLLQPLGPLSYTYHQPLASFSVELAKNWSWNTYWNYDQYKESDFNGPTLPRYFHDNRATIALRYAF